MLTAITREVNTGLGSCELTFLPRVEIDTELASQQHKDYQSVLSSLGCNLIDVPTGPGLADSVFVEDTAVVLDEIAVMCRPGAASRRAEVAGVEAVLRPFRSLASIKHPGTLDGGDVLCVGKKIYVGISTRSNRQGIEQLGHIVGAFGYTVEGLTTAHCLHLKSAVTQLAPDTLLINRNWIDATAFSDHDLIDVDSEEPHAANALKVGSDIVYPSSFPRTLDKLAQRGFSMAPVDVSELQKAEGSITCCSLILKT